MANSYDLSKLSADEALYLRAKATYYIGEPIIDDVEFDILEEQLREVDSFVVDIVGTIKIKGNKVTVSRGKLVFLPHLTPMGSLAKIQFKPNFVPYVEFQNWVLSNVPKDTEVHVEFGPKLDGNAINMIYNDGKLVSITSRGDGIEGQDYTSILSNSVPKVIKGFTGEIRGEAVVDTYLFDTVYGPNSGNTTKTYANARNFVAGALAKGIKEIVTDIDIVAFQIVGFVGDTRAQLIKWGFDILDFTQTYEASQLTLPVFEKIYSDFKTYRETCKYQLDGIVAKMDESVRDQIGGNSHHPFWALAIKFETPAVYTQIIGVDWTIGKNGQLSPVAILAPVDLLGSVVQRASVYNASWMLKNKCYPGARISLIKSGDIIPKIIEIVEESSETFDLPTEWNGHAVSFDGVQLMVDGFEDTDEFKSLKLHASIVALGIAGIGPSGASKLQTAGITLIDLLSETPSGLRMKLLNSGEFKDGRDLEILVENVFDLTSVELWQVIYAMGYRKCGKTVSKQLANWMTKIDYDFKGLEKQVIEDFVMDSTCVDAVKELVGILLNNNVTVVKPEAPKQGLISFEMSGSPTTHGTKDEFRREVEQSGKCIHTSLSKSTNYLIVESMAINTTKMQKAQKNNTICITYSDFLTLIRSL